MMEEHEQSEDVQAHLRKLNEDSEPTDEQGLRKLSDDDDDDVEAHIRSGRQLSDDEDEDSKSHGRRF
jgi:hypothetical protein